MRTNTGLWWLLAAFFALMAIVYTIWNLVTHFDTNLTSGQPYWQSFTHSIEWVGSVALLFTALMSTLIAFYISRVHRAQGGELPEDVLDVGHRRRRPRDGRVQPVVAGGRSRSPSRPRSA